MGFYFSCQLIYTTLTTNKMEKILMKSVSHMLCISTREQVLRMPFASWNQFLDAKTAFYVLFSHKMYKMMQKITKKPVCWSKYTTHINTTLLQQLTVIQFNLPCTLLVILCRLILSFLLCTILLLRYGH